MFGHAPGSCTCVLGWQGATCDEDVDECATADPCTGDANAQCVNTPGSVKCVCNLGFVSTNGVCTGMSQATVFFFYYHRI